MLITKSEKEAFDKTVKENFLWSHPEKFSALRENKDFVAELFGQNLEHCRHVEGERLTYCACFTALAGGGLAAMSTLKDEPLAGLVISLMLLVLSVFSVILNERWSNAFVRHLTYAKGCYYILHCLAHCDVKNEDPAAFPDGSLDLKSFNEALINNGCNEQKLPQCKERFKLDADPDIYLDTLPLYCFGVNNPAIKIPLCDKYWVSTIKTRTFLRGYYLVCFVLILIVFLYMLALLSPQGNLARTINSLVQGGAV